MSPRNLLRPLVASLAVLLAACTTGGQSLSVSPPLNPEVYYFRGYARVDTEFLNRYACSDPHLLLKCTCTSRLARYCDCRC